MGIDLAFAERNGFLYYSVIFPRHFQKINFKKKLCQCKLILSLLKLKGKSDKVRFHFSSSPSIIAHNNIHINEMVLFVYRQKCEIFGEIKKKLFPSWERKKKKKKKKKS